jgi:hypothetical protein
MTAPWQAAQWKKLDRKIYFIDIESRTESQIQGDGHSNGFSATAF